MRLRARSDAAVREVVDRFVDALAAREVDAALALVAPAGSWDAEMLATVIRHYGFIEPRRDGRTFEVTPPAAASGDGPRFEVTWFEEPAPDGVTVGYATYDLPLNGEWSDVSAVFDIRDEAEGLCLALDDVHVL